MKLGKLIVIEGCDGAGVGTQANLLKEGLEKLGKKVLLLRYPDEKNEIGRLIHRFLHREFEFDAKIQFLLYSLDFIKDMEKIKKELEKGTIVICDRYFTSTLVYQTLQGFPLKNALKFANFFGIIEPDLTFYLQVKPETGLVRKKGEKRKDLDRFESDLKWQKKVIKKYKDLIDDKIFSKKWIKVDGEKTKKEVARDISHVLQEELGLRNPLNFIILGPQYSGKGTHGKFISKKFFISFISMSDLLKEEVKKGSKAGKKIEKYMEEGILVPDKIILRVIKKRLARKDLRKGFILEGYPRTIAQAEVLEKIKKPDLAIYLDVTKKTIFERAFTRLTCKNCGAIYNTKFVPPKKPGICDLCNGPLVRREDETEKAIKKRLDEYNKKTKPLLKYYEKKGILGKVDGNGLPDEVDERILEMLKEEGFLD